METRTEPPSAEGGYNGKSSAPARRGPRLVEGELGSQLETQHPDLSFEVGYWIGNAREDFNV